MRNVAVDGATATVTRPEAVRLVPGDGAVVVATERDGPVVRLRVRLDDGGELEALATGVDHPRIGDRVAVEVDPDGIVRVPVFDPSAATDDFGEPAPSTRHQRPGGEDHG